MKVTSKFINVLPGLVGGNTMTSKGQRSVSSVRKYWDTHPLGTQFVHTEGSDIGGPEFFAHIRPWMGPFKFPWYMERIEREAKILEGCHLIEIGCGLGFDSLEFLKRGVKVTATDLTQTGVDLTRRHFELEGYQAEDVRVENVLALSFKDNTFDAAWASGVLHHTGNTEQAIREIHRVVKPQGRAIISHFYRRPSWLHWLSRIVGENIEFEDQDPPVTDFLTEAEILRMFDGFTIVEASQEHYRALPIGREGFKAGLYSWVFLPLFNLLPAMLAKRIAHKFTVTAIKK